MQYALVVAALVGAVAAQSQCASLALALPGCAQTCLLSAASKVGCTEALDFSCQCQASIQASLSTLAEPCVVKACGIATAESIPALASSICVCAASAGGSSPSSAAGGSTTPAATGTGAATTGASTGSGSGASAPASTGAASTAAAGTSAPASISTGAAAAPSGAIAAMGGIAAGIIGLAAVL